MYEISKGEAKMWAWFKGVLDKTVARAVQNSVPSNAAKSQHQHFGSKSPTYLSIPELDRVQVFFSLSLLSQIYAVVTMATFE